MNKQTFSGQLLHEINVAFVIHMAHVIFLLINMGMPFELVSNKAISKVHHSRMIQLLVPHSSRSLVQKVKFQKARIPTNKQRWKSYHGTILLWKIHKNILGRGC